MVSHNSRGNICAEAYSAKYAGSFYSRPFPYYSRRADSGATHCRAWWAWGAECCATAGRSADNIPGRKTDGPLR